MRKLIKHIAKTKVRLEQVERHVMFMNRKIQHHADSP